MPSARGPKLPPWEKPFFVGIDENGMGPRLGPLVVTSVLAEVDRAGARRVTSRPRGDLAKRIGDSKKLVAFDDSALGEAWARALVARDGAAPATPDELLATVGLDPQATLQAPCPRHHVDLCWSSEGEAFAADRAMVEACSADLERLAKRGVRIVRVRVAVICTRQLNEAVARGLSRFDLDLHTMERLALAAREDASDEIYALCGKVGGFGFYGERFGPLAGRLHTVLVEGRARSEYQFPGIGRLAFVRDADESSMLVGLASLVGKWARDHLMRRVVRFHRTGAPGLPEASGYHDPVTARFIRASELVRRERRVEQACFERVALGKRDGAATLRASSEAAPPPPPPRRSRGAPSPS
jgi:ribonuclease HII